MDIWLGGPIHPKRISRYQAIQSASNGANKMTRRIIPALVAMLVSGPVWGNDVAICNGTL